MKTEPSCNAAAEPLLNEPLAPIRPALEPQTEVWVPEIESDADAIIDPDAIVEEAEQLLREAAPHDYDVLVIGGGPAGQTAALGAARGGLKVALVEEKALGGAYLHNGCLASKILLADVQSAATAALPDLAALQVRKTRMIEQIRRSMQAELELAGVKLLPGRARFVEEHTLEIEASGPAPRQTRRVTAVHVVVAVGGIPQPSPLPGADSPGVVTCEALLEQNVAPPRLVVVGATWNGVELATLFALLGSQVTLLEASEGVLPAEDADLQAAVRQTLQREGVAVETEVAVTRIEATAGASRVVYEQAGQQKQVEAEQVLLLSERVANLDRLGLEALLRAAGVEPQSDKIGVASDFQTPISGIYSVGDCIRREGWASQAVRDGHEVANTLLGLAPEKTVAFCAALLLFFASSGLGWPHAERSA